MNLITDTLPAPQSSGLQFEVVDDFDRLQMIAEDWQELLSRSAADEPMLSPSWLLPWWRNYGRDRQLAVGLVYDDFRLVGVMPLLRRRYWYRLALPFWRLEPLGADVDEADGVCSDYLGLIAEKESERRVTRVCVQSLMSGAFGRWDELVMSAMDGDHPMTTMLLDELKQAGLEASLEVTGCARYAPLPGSFDEYLQSLNGKNRYYVRRAVRDFENWAGSDFQLHQATTLEGLEDGKRILRDLHHERWLAEGHRGAFGAKRFVDFHDEVMPKLLGEGRLELIWLTVRGEPVAALYNIIASGKLYFYQCGRSLDVPKRQRPGIVLFAKAIERAIEHGLREFDFLGGESQYKGQLALASRDLVQVRAVRSGMLESVRKAGGCCVSWLRGLRNAIRGLAGRRVPA